MSGVKRGTKHKEREENARRRRKVGTYLTLIASELCFIVQFTVVVLKSVFRSVDVNRGFESEFRRRNIRLLQKRRPSVD
jgi:hypothetical protein